MADTMQVQAPARRPAALGVLGVVAVLVVAGLAIGRFVTYGSSPIAAPAPAPATEATAEARIASLERTVAAEPGNVAARQALGVAYVRQAAAVGDPSYYDLASAAFDSADSLAPDDAGTLLGRGALALALHRFDEALDLGSAVLASRPSSVEALGVVVDAQVELGRYDEAAITLQRMLDVRPALSALSRASYVRELHGDLAGAIELMQQAEMAGAAQPADASVVAALVGDLWLKAGDLDAASAAYSRAGALPAASVGQARVLAARCGRAGAITLLEDVVDRFPLPTALVLLGELRSSADWSVLRATAALQESSGQVVDLEMAVFEADHGDPARAVELARAAWAARPDNVHAADALAWSLFRSGDVAGARPLVDQALRLGTADPQLRLHAASILSATGEAERARQEVAAALPMRLALGVEDGARLQSLASSLGVVVPA